MIASLLLGLSIGFLGSWHCIAMCGPLAMALPYRTKKPFPRLIKALLYTAGRTSTYMLIGLMLATIGEGFSFLGLQRIISLVMGLVLLFIVCIPSVNRKLELVIDHTSMGRWVKKTIAQQYKTRGFSTFFLVGLLNGLLPCGIVYMAAFTAMGSTSFQTGWAIMLGFGLGTLPLMTVMAILPARDWIPRLGGFRLSQALMFAAGMIMVLRAMVTDLPDVPAMGAFNPQQLTICK